MPIYEYYSADTHKIYSFYARKLVGPDVVPRCPDSGGKKMERVLSPFAITGRAKEKTEELGGEGMPDLDPRQEAEMMQLAGEMSGMDEGNPDPRQLGRLMRRMMDITGEKMPEPMLEMLARMEKGRIRRSWRRNTGMCSITTQWASSGWERVREKKAPRGPCVADFRPGGILSFTRCPSISDC